MKNMKIGKGWLLPALLLALIGGFALFSDDASTFDIGKFTQYVRWTPGTLAGSDNMVLPGKGVTIKLTGTAKITRIQPTFAGRFVVLNTTSTDTLVDGANLKLAGNFNGTADDCIGLVYSITGAIADSAYTEVFRSLN